MTSENNHHSQNSLSSPMNSLVEHLKANTEFMDLFGSLSAPHRRMLAEPCEDSAGILETKSDAILEMIYRLCAPSELRNELERQMLLELSVVRDKNLQRGSTSLPFTTEKVIQMDRKLIREFRTYNSVLPLSIWHCCQRNCFAVLAADPELVLAFDEVIHIHEIACYCREQVSDVPYLVKTRRLGKGGSNMAESYLTRKQREQNAGTDRQKALKRLRDYVVEVLPFLSGKAESRTGVPKLSSKLCVHAISCLLGVSYNFIYLQKHSTAAGKTTEGEVMDSLLDTAGVRLRKMRRIGIRTGFPAIADLPGYNCGCASPCFSNAPPELLQKWYNEFKSYAQQLRSREKENRYLLNQLMCPMLNRPISFCNKSLAALFTVSSGRIADVRRVLESLSRDLTADADAVMEEAVRGYNYRNGHPMNRMRLTVRERIETYLDMILRPDPGASDGVNTCRVYSPEINTQEKLRKLLAQQLEDDDITSIPLSSTTLQRMVQRYLDSKNCKISFNQSDHNACPSCKSMKYALLQFSLERKELEKELSNCKANANRQPDELELIEKTKELATAVDEKAVQESICLREMKTHIHRDARIRGFLKRLTDVFRKACKRRQQQELEETEVSVNGWCQNTNEAIITHQDDMTKVDLPSFVENASSDITRWRYDINAHVDAITGNSVVFSHEQGSGPKDASSITELILLDHILRCRGEAIKIIVSDNAAVGKNWLTTVALPQYLVDQGLADIAVVVYLENNHGKWLADMLFGQLQLRRKRTTLPGVDSLLSEFESINRRNGYVQGFVVNPLSSVSYEKVFQSLGYSTKPPSDFMFVRRNIHFATACDIGAKERLSSELKEIFGEMLPTEPGTVRLSSDPPGKTPQRQLEFEQRYVDAPAAERSAHGLREAINKVEDALVVPSDHPFADGGNYVVSKRNMDKVGYNGLVFRAKKAFPEMKNTNDPLVKETWPPGLLAQKDGKSSSPPELLSESENLKCAPENWIARRPVRQSRNEDADFVARYPPRNMLNAKFGNGPRSAVAYDDTRWKPTRTYTEPPFPLSFSSQHTDSCAHWALLELREKHKDDAKSLTTLDLLATVYARMEHREAYAGQWFQRPATKASNSAWDKFDENVILVKSRERGRPKAPKTVKQVFREDPAIKEKVANIKQEQQVGQKNSTTKITNKLFEETASIPGGLDRYEWLAAKDMERYANELKHFKEVVQRKFDEEHDILPLATSPSEG